MKTARRPHLALPTGLLLALALLRPWLEATMARHMALEIPALFLAGWLFSLHVRPDARQAFCAWNQAGLANLMLSSLCLMCWMLPVVFDAAVLDWRVAMLKVASLLLAGGLAGWAWPRLHLIVRFAFVLNLSGMNILMGVLYLTAPQQLCSAYQSNEQVLAGIALLAWGAGILFIFLAWWLRKLAQSSLPSGTTTTPTNEP